SAIAAGLTAVTLLAWGARLGSHKTGWWAAIIFTLSLQTFMHGKAAVADMWLVLFMTVAFWSGWEVWDRSTLNAQRSTPNAQWLGSNHLWWWAFYVSLALAFLAKGPIGLIPLIPLIWMMIRTGNPRTWLLLVAGLLLTIAIISLWAIPALVRTNGEFFRIGIGRHVVGRSIGAMEGHGAESIGLYLLLLPYYFVAAFLSFFPWSYKLPWLFRRVKNGRDLTDTYLLLGILSVFVIFTLVATKLPHYTLPAFPLMALLLARHWTGDAENADRMAGGFKRLAISTAALWVAISLILPPVFAKQFPSYALYQKTRDALRPEMEFGAVDYVEPSLVWYFRSQVDGYMTPLRKKRAAAFMEKPGPRFVILPTATANGVFPQIPEGWKVVSTSGVNIPKGRRVDLTLVLKPN
ncbi:MAG TPA: phospholipid carrier-dependent glycosyltransferase, partial [Chthoniobacterales bacterium]|nr:phospholipid carrier-dependent glycosyltransferase [Chthoniobacterales bacterium]